MKFDLIFNLQGFDGVNIDTYNVSFYLNPKSNILNKVL